MPKSGRRRLDPYGASIVRATNAIQRTLAADPRLRKQIRSAQHWLVLARIILSQRSALAVVSRAPRFSSPPSAKSSSKCKKPRARPELALTGVELTIAAVSKPLRARISARVGLPSFNRSKRTRE
jgi:hypothetical protein